MVRYRRIPHPARDLKCLAALVVGSLRPRASPAMRCDTHPGYVVAFEWRYQLQTHSKFSSDAAGSSPPLHTATGALSDEANGIQRLRKDVGAMRRETQAMHNRTDRLPANERLYMFFFLVGSWTLPSLEHFLKRRSTNTWLYAKAAMAEMMPTTSSKHVAVTAVQ